MNSNSQGYFPVRVLSLPGDDARRQPLLSKLDRLKISFEVFMGVDGRDGLADEHEKLIDRTLARIRNRRDFSDAEFACALSHLSIYQDIVAKNLPGAIVLEDDAIILDGFAEFVDHRAYHKADIVLLGHHRTFVRPRRQAIKLTAGVNGLQIARPPLGAYGYSLSRSAAQTIIRRSFPVSKNADWPCDISRLDCLASVPCLVDANHDGSHIQEERRTLIGKTAPPGLSSLRRAFILDDWSRLIGKLQGTRLP